MRRIRDHLTYANVMATLAVFLVLSGGTAVALNGADAVQSDDLGPGAQVQAADVAANAVGSADVINESLTSADVANGQLNDEDVGQGTFVDFTGSIGNVPALGCVEKPITGVNATGDHLLLTPNWNTQSTPTRLQRRVPHI